MHNELLEKYILYRRTKCMILTKKTSIKGLVNASIGDITDIICIPSCRSPYVPTYLVGCFVNYIRPPWNQEDLKCVPIVPITLVRDNFHSPCNVLSLYINPKGS